eukprot:4999137-Pyramimonas_sp.AAC.2
MHATHPTRSWQAKCGSIMCEGGLLIPIPCHYLPTAIRLTFRPRRTFCQLERCTLRPRRAADDTREPEVVERESHARTNPEHALDHMRHLLMIHVTAVSRGIGFEAF